MSRSEPFRPKLHFAPQNGWQNDPNGMIVVDGVYHLFFQHDPDSTKHGPMHWGHATSTDLVHWEERPIALWPDVLGTCFSGSAIETEEGEIKLFYTAHQRIDGQDFQTQCLVHADRALETFSRHPGNPVIDNPGLGAFRDPKVIWHEPSQRWIMLVTHGQSIGFYASTDFVDWRLLSTFGEQDGQHGPGPWECPDMVPLIAPSGETVWVLIVGIGADALARGTGTQYFIGQFDGTHFINANTPQTVLWLDSGRDYYATQTFFDRRGGAPVAISWASNGHYAQQTPTVMFRGSMSLPRALGLVHTVDGLRVAAQVPAPVQSHFPTESDDGTYRIAHVATLAEGDSLALTLFGEAAPQFVLTRTGPDACTVRTTRADYPDMRDFGHDYTVRLPWPQSVPLDLSISVDRGYVEFSAGEGLLWISNLFFPQDLNAKPRLDLRHG